MSMLSIEIYCDEFNDVIFLRKTIGKSYKVALNTEEMLYK